MVYLIELSPTFTKKIKCNMLICLVKYGHYTILIRKSYEPTCIVFKYADVWRPFISNGKPFNISLILLLVPLANYKTMIYITFVSLTKIFQPNWHKHNYDFPLNQLKWKWVDR